jgi:hypothetical protein
MQYRPIYSVFGMPVYEPVLAVLIAVLVSVLAVRALGETDLNPGTVM